MRATKFRPLLFTASISAAIAPMHVGAAAVHTVDVLGIYTSDVASQLTDPKAAFVSHVEYANKALQNSGANYRYNLVHVMQRNWPQDDGIGSSQLSSIMEDSTIRSLREEYGADLVAGMVPTSNGYCGIGYLPPADSSTHVVSSHAKKYGYSLTGHNCGGRAMAHEMGHNMGLGHSPAQDSTGTVATWGRGWGQQNSFVSIMAYGSAYGVYSSAGHVQVHSNPLLSVCDGHACGNPIGKADGADAVQALNLAAPQISQWMASVDGVPQNNAPVAASDSASTEAGNSVIVNVLQNDSDPDGDTLTIGAVSNPLHGTALANTARTSIAYTPNTGFDGADSFTYTVSDGRGATAQAEVFLTVSPVAIQPPLGDGGMDGNLVVNAGAELGDDGWSVFRSAGVGMSTITHSGNQSITADASKGGGVLVDLLTPFEGSANLDLSGWLKGSPNDVVYVYLRAKQSGVWRYTYMTAFMLGSSEWTNFQATRYVSGSDVTDGYLLFYFPYGTLGTVLIDDIRAELQ